MPKFKQPRVKVGDTVRRLAIPFDETTAANMTGVVLQVTPKRFLGGHARAIVRVLWASGSTALHEDRVLVRV